MSATSVIDVRAFILGEFAEPLRALGMEPGDLPDDFDLLTSGVVDSLGIVSMVVAIEDRFGVSLDELEASHLTNLGHLTSYVVAKSPSE